MAKFSYSSASKPTQRAPAKPNQVKNNAGGFVFSLEPKKQLERFLILGSDSNTYYQNAPALTRENTLVVQKSWLDDPKGTAGLIKDVSTTGRAAKNSPAIFAVALGTLSDSLEARREAYGIIKDVCRTGTHVFELVNHAMNLGKGFGRGFKRAISSWYDDKPIDRLALQVIKYRQREGFNHNRLLDLSHPKGSSPAHKELYTWITGHPVEVTIPIVKDFLLAQDLKEAKGNEFLIRRLPWEAVPTELHNDPLLWKTLIPDMGMTALMRNLGRFARLDITKPFSDEEQIIVRRFNDPEEIKKSRLHPFNILVALVTYKSGQGFRGKESWVPNQNVIAAMEAGYHHAFENVIPSNERVMIGLDVSGSMGFAGGYYPGVMNSPLSPREAAAAMVMVTLSKEPLCHVYGFSHQFIQMNVTRYDSLTEIIRKTSGLPFGRTDCALPMVTAQGLGLKVDKFVIYTDNETWYGKVHPFQALKDYRRSSGIDAKLVVVGFTATNFTIADPSDSKMLDVVGFDSGAPAYISKF